MSTPLTEVLKNAVPLAKAQYPAGMTPSLPSKHRHALQGVLNRAGERVKLATWKIGGKLCTTPEAIEEFLQRLNEGHADDARESETDIARRNRETREALRAVGV